MALLEKIQKLIREDEDEYHDFKVEWYQPNKRDEMIKDIFSFVNTIHHQDCYLIIGVNDNHEIKGVENDKNRLNTQKLTDTLASLPIANYDVPKLIVKSLKLENHIVDVIIIKNTNDVPVYLDEDKRPKGCENVIHAGQIFVRLNDTNTGINKTAKDYQVEKLWKKRFGLDLPVNQQYKVKLLDVNNWEYFENDQIGFRYNVDPDYCMYLVDDKEKRYNVESYSLSQMRTRMDWQVLKLMYRDRLIRNILVVWLDGGRFITVTPDMDVLDDGFADNMLNYRYFSANTLDFYVENLLFHQKNHATSGDYFQRSSLLKDIVVYTDDEQRQKVKSMLKDKIPEISKKVEPSDEQIKKYKDKMRMDFNSYDPEFTDSNIKFMCKQKNLTEYINNFITNKTDFKIPYLL